MTPTTVPPSPRRMGRVNWRGAWELYLKEVRRFVKVYLQTIASPIVTTLLFLAIFALALGRQVPDSGGVSFIEFLAPGLIIMAMVQNAFANTSSSMVISKVQGNIVDVLMPPLSAAELTAAYALGGTTRGVVVGIATTAAMAFFVQLHLHDALYIVYHGVMASLMLSLLGLIGGIWADKFDHIAAVTNFIVTPLSFLSGTFYSIERLPEHLQFLAHLNPFFYMIDGFRHGFFGVSDTSPWVSLVIVGTSFLLVAAFTLRLLAIGYKIRA